MANKTLFSTNASQEGSADEYIAGRYADLSAGHTLSSTFETQRGIPYDGSNKLARRLSPFTLRLVIPEAVVSALDIGVDVNLLSRASRDTRVASQQATAIREALGLTSVLPGAEGVTAPVTTRAAGQRLQTTLGTQERAVLTDLTTVADIRYQVQTMLNVPPLTLFINPNNLSTSYTAVQQFSERSRNGLIFQRWGEDQVALSISGSTGAFAAGNAPPTTFGPPTAGSYENTVPTGVQFASKRDSAAFQQFVSLYQFYRNNGYVYDTVNGTDAHLMIGAVAIDYDQWTYVGHIESFEYSYDAENPHRIEWSMEFIVGRMYDHAEAPVVVGPQSSPTPGVGQLSARELADLTAGSASRADLVSKLSRTDSTPAGEFSSGQTPLDVLGYFTPTGLLG